MLKRLVIFLVLIAVLGGIVYTFSPGVGGWKEIAESDARGICLPEREVTQIGPVIIYQCPRPGVTFVEIFIGRLSVFYTPSWVENEMVARVSYEDWVGVWVESYESGETTVYLGGLEGNYPKKFWKRLITFHLPWRG